MMLVAILVVVGVIVWAEIEYRCALRGIARTELPSWHEGKKDWPPGRGD